MDRLLDIPDLNPPKAGGDGVVGGFHTTHWSVVMMAGQENSPAAGAALERLCQIYWYPLYAYCRRQGCAPPDGEDLTQQFLVSFIERNSFATATPERGRFRNFLLTSFKNFLANEHHRRTTVKRGGRMAFVSIDDTDLETQFRNEPVDSTTPEHNYDRAWAMTLLGKVMKDLKADYAAAGKVAAFETLQGFLTGDKSDQTYVTIGNEMGVSESAVKMAVMRLRQRYGQMLRREIAHTLADPAGVEEELRHLVQAMSAQG